MTIIEQITTVAQGLCWNVEINTSEPNLVEFDFQQYTPKGQDFSFSVGMKVDDINGFLNEIEKYYEAFDADYEAYLWIGTDGHGKHGAPYHIIDIVADMEQAEARIKTLYEILKTAIQ